MKENGDRESEEDAAGEAAMHEAQREIGLTGEPLRIVKLSASNVKRLVAVEIVPSGDGSVVEIRGKNAVGKSSVLDAIAMALGGMRLCPHKPIREGRSEGKVSVDLGLLTVTRRFTLKGSTLTIKDKLGNPPLSSPQAILDRLSSNLTFDPLEFTRLDAAGQVESLLGLLGVESKLEALASLETRNKESRLDWGRAHKRFKASLDEMPVPPDDTPAEKLSVVELLEKLKSEQAVVERCREVRAAHAEAQTDLRRVEESEDMAKRRVEDAKTALAEAEHQRDAAIKHTEDETAEVARFAHAVDNLPTPDTETISKSIADAERVNANVDMRLRRAEKRKEAEHAHANEQQAVMNLEKIKNQRTELLHAAEWPVDGLGFSEHGVTYNGIPFKQLAASEGLRVGAAIQMAKNPTLRIMRIHDGSLLDDETLAALYAQTRKEGYQLWIERVGEHDLTEMAVVIEDGMVRETEALDEDFREPDSLGEDQ